MSSEFESKLAAQQWLGIIVIAIVSVVLGAGLGFVSQALLPVKTFPVLPKPAAKGQKQEPLPKVYWLKQGTAKTIGNFRAKEKAIKEGLQTDLNDREIGQWLNLVFSGKEDPKEDIDAKIGTPFVRIGGQTKESATEPVLTVTMPFKLKIFTLPVSEVPLQFTAKPVYNGQETSWEITEMRTGHARVPTGLVSETASRAVTEILSSDEKGRGKEMLEKLSAYRRIVIKDNKVFLEAPVKVVGDAAKTAPKPAPTPAPVTTETTPPTEPATPATNP
jgi:hypothetical protein